MSDQPPVGNSLNFPPGGSMCLVATNSAKTINLPTPDTGRVVHIVDSTGGANQFPITIVPTGADVTIRNGYNTIVQPFGTLSFLANNNNWYAIVNESGITNLRTVIASNVSAAVVSTSYGFFSTISTGSVFGKHIGDGSLLTAIPNNGAVLAVSNLVTTNATSITTISNLLNSVSTNVTTVSTNLNTLSNNVTTISNTGATNTTNITTVSNSTGTNTTNITTISNLLNSVSTNVTNVSTNLNTLSNNVTTVSNTAGTNATNITTISNRINYLLTVSNYSAITMSTSFGFFSTISTGSVYGKHFGDGSLLTGLPAGGLTILPPVMSTTVMSSGIITGNLISTLNLSTTFGFISSLTVDSLSFGVANGFINMGDVITTSMSSIQTFTSSLLTTNLQVGIVSSLSYIAFPGLQLGYNQTVIAEQSIGTGLQELLFFKGSTNTDRIRMQTTGTIVFEPGVSARVFPSASSNATPAMIITTGSNVGIGVLAPTVSLDVAGAGRFTALSVNTLSTSQLNSGNICNVGWLSNGGALSNLGGGAFFAGTSNTGTLGVAGIATFASISNTGVISTVGLNVGSLSSINISTVNLTAGFISTINLGANSAYITNLFVGTEDFGSLLTATSNITQTGGTTRLSGLSVNTISTSFISACNISSYSLSTTLGYFSTISSGAFYGKHIGDGSLLTGLPAAGITSIPQVLSTLAFFTSSISTATIQTSNIQIGTVSSLSYLAFPGLQQQYTQSVLAEVSTGTGLQEMLLFRGSTATDRIRMQTTGSIIFETGVGARVFPAAPSNVTPAMIINTSSNVGIGIAAPTVTLDVAGAGRFQTLSTQQIHASSFVGGVVSVATIYATTVSSLAGFFSSVNNYQVGGALYLPTQIFTF